jgi:hypothetical protein
LVALIFTVIVKRQTFFLIVARKNKYNPDYFHIFLAKSVSGLVSLIAPLVFHKTKKILQEHFYFRWQKMIVYLQSNVQALQFSLNNILFH